MSTTLSRSIVIAVLAALVVVLLAVPAFALPGQPNFGEAIYADGEAWGTKVVSVLEEPNPTALETSFDKFYVVTNGYPGQLPVGEAAPGKGYNGGRWYTHTVTWNDPADAVLLKSEYMVLDYYDLGELTITAGSPDFHPNFFVCPLLPVK